MCMYMRGICIYVYVYIGMSVHMCMYVCVCANMSVIHVGWCVWVCMCVCHSLYGIVMSKPAGIASMVLCQNRWVQTQESSQKKGSL